jgi:hypothetical protein
MGALLSLIAFVAALWVIYEVWTKNNRLTTGYKILWTLAALVFNVFTAIAYYVVEKKNMV